LDDAVKIKKDFVNRVLDISQVTLVKRFSYLVGVRHKESWSNPGIGLRSIGSESVIKYELYHVLRKQSQKMIVATEFKPFSGKNRIGGFPRSWNPAIDLALFEDIQSVGLVVPKVLIEMKNTGGEENVKGAVNNDLKKLKKIAKGMKEKFRKTPDMLIVLVFIESPPESVLGSVSREKFNLNRFVDAGLVEEIRRIGKSLFYSAPLWRDGGGWKIRKVVPD
jgi:hypothetical protein